MVQWNVSTVDWQAKDGRMADDCNSQDDTKGVSIDWPSTGKSLSDLWQEDESSSDEDFP